ncbi:hypothetical protein CONLIGDRAFT_707070 [Coniochaeta ligniaria NRRL 30616]|uniref:ABM domain-containing protein n=1 Tax=Coniochaeta ligniaria NRRL 30616 TaxID=1408157 RepID=A0A1J7IGZ9_9PEZI|nr:hypothetical protein CONLIGDRAFT_707070 [Coniochaeta ligniaria NRRL 30616]
MPLAPVVYPGVPDSEGCSLHVTIYISPENVPAWFEAFKPVYEAGVAEQECSFFMVYQDPEDPGKLSWVQHWEEELAWWLSTASQKHWTMASPTSGGGDTTTLSTLPHSNDMTSHSLGGGGGDWCRNKNGPGTHVSDLRCQDM